MSWFCLYTRRTVPGRTPLGEIDDSGVEDGETGESEVGVTGGGQGGSEFRVTSESRKRG